MRSPWRPIAASALALALWACVPMDGFYSGRDTHHFCGSDPKKRVATADWAEAEPVDVRIRQGSFWPMILTLRKDRPYILRIANADPESRVFSAPPLFEAAYLESVTVAGKKPQFNPVDGLLLPPAATAEVQLMALCTGRYEFRETWLRYIDDEAGRGVIYVE